MSTEGICPWGKRPFLTLILVVELQRVKKQYGVRGEA